MYRKFLTIFLLTFVLAPNVLAQDLDRALIDKDAKDENIEWVWAEVISIDEINNRLEVKYVDYDRKTEEQMPILVNEKTEFDGVTSLSEIKKGDYVSVDYEVIDDENQAIFIIVESVEDEDAAGPGM